MTPHAFYRFIFNALVGATLTAGTIALMTSRLPDAVAATVALATWTITLGATLR